MDDRVVIPLRPWLAAALSLVIPGLGEMYCGRRQQGLVVLIVSIVTLYGCGLAPLLSAINAWRLASTIRFLEVPASAAKPTRIDAADVVDVVGDLLD